MSSYLTANENGSLNPPSSAGLSGGKAATVPTSYSVAATSNSITSNTFTPPPPPLMSTPVEKESLNTSAQSTSDSTGSSYVANPAGASPSQVAASGPSVHPVSVAPSATPPPPYPISSTNFTASLYVGDLSPEVTEEKLFEIFNSAGKVTSLRLCKDTSPINPFAYAYVNYHSVADAERALGNLNHTKINGIPTRMMWSQRDPGLRKSGTGNIIIRNLDKTIDPKVFHDKFSDYGNILSSKIAFDEMGNSRGYAFVHYEDEQDAKKAIQYMNGAKLGNKKVFVGPFLKKQERKSISDDCFTNIYIKNIPDGMTEKALVNIFQRVGPITSTFLQKDSKGRQFGMLNYATNQEAKRAVEEYNNLELNYYGIPVQVHQKYLVESISDDDEEKVKAGKGTESTSVTSIDGESNEIDKVDSSTPQGVEGEKSSHSAPGTAEKEKAVEGAASTLPNRSQHSGEEITEGEKEKSTSSIKGEEIHLNDVKDGTSTEPVDSVSSGTTETNKENAQVSETFLLYVAPHQGKNQRAAILREKFNSSINDSRFKENTNVYIKNLDESIDDAILQSIFEPYGTLQSVKVMRDEKGASKGFGFVSFCHADEAAKAITEANSKIVKGKRLFVTLAEKREYRQARLQRYRQSIYNTSNPPSTHGSMHPYSLPHLAGPHPTAHLQSLQSHPSASVHGAANPALSHSLHSMYVHPNPNSHLNNQAPPNPHSVRVPFPLPIVHQLQYAAASNPSSLPFGYAPTSQNMNYTRSMLNASNTTPNNQVSTPNYPVSANAAALASTQGGISASNLNASHQTSVNSNSLPPSTHPVMPGSTPAHTTSSPVSTQMSTNNANTQYASNWKNQNATSQSNTAGVVTTNPLVNSASTNPTTMNTSLHQMVPSSATSSGGNASASFPYNPYSASTPSSQTPSSVNASVPAAYLSSSTPHTMRNTMNSHSYQNVFQHGQSNSMHPSFINPSHILPSTGGAPSQAGPNSLAINSTVGGNTATTSQTHSSANVSTSAPPPPSTTHSNLSPNLNSNASRNVNMKNSFKFTPQARNRMESTLPGQTISTMNVPANSGHYVNRTHVNQPSNLNNAAPIQDTTSMNNFGVDYHSTAAYLASMDPIQKKQLLGERLFPIVKSQQPDYAGKITGMMLEMDNSEILNLLESETQLHAKIVEAMNVLESYPISKKT